MKEKEMYTFTELLDNLKIPVSELCRRAHVTEGTIGNIRRGHAIRRSTANKLLGCLSEIYERELSLENVKGLDLENRLATEKPATVPSRNETRDTTPALETPQISPAMRNPGGAPKSDIPDDLPEGTIKLIDFISKHRLAQSSINYYINKGFKDEKIETTTRPRPSGSGGVSHFLTPEQQEKALDFLRRHGKLKTAQPEPQEKPGAEEHPWWSPDGQ
jgi:hypothetical protein